MLPVQSGSNAEHAVQIVISGRTREASHNDHGSCNTTCGHFISLSHSHSDTQRAEMQLAYSEQAMLLEFADSAWLDYRAVLYMYVLLPFILVTCVFVFTFFQSRSDGPDVTLIGKPVVWVTGSCCADLPLEPLVTSEEVQLSLCDYSVCSMMECSSFKKNK